MGQQQSKDELLYQQVKKGSIDGTKSLHADGAGLEWSDRQGKTPLIVACMKPGLYNVAKTLIELGANINAYCPGRYAGTPLHHAAKTGLDQTVHLLISHGANALVMNDDCQTPLELARANGYSKVVRAIEAHICLFSGFLKEVIGPDFLERTAPHFTDRKLWVVVLPCGSRDPEKPFKLEIAIYTDDPKQSTVVAHWKVNVEEPDFNQPGLAIVAFIDTTTWSRLRLAALTENDKQQLRSLCNACKGIPQVDHHAPQNSEHEGLALDILASLQSLTVQRPDPVSGHNASSSTIHFKSSNSVATLPGIVNYHEQNVPDSGSVGVTVQHMDSIDDDPNHYPTIDASATLLDLSAPSLCVPVSSTYFFNLCNMLGCSGRGNVPPVWPYGWSRVMSERN